MRRFFEILLSIALEHFEFQMLCAHLAVQAIDFRVERVALHAFLAELVLDFFGFQCDDALELARFRLVESRLALVIRFEIRDVRRVELRELRVNVVDFEFLATIVLENLRLQRFVFLANHAELRLEIPLLRFILLDQL